MRPSCKEASRSTAKEFEVNFSKETSGSEAGGFCDPTCIKANNWLTKASGSAKLGLNSLGADFAAVRRLVECNDYLKKRAQKHPYQSVLTKGTR